MTLSKEHLDQIISRERRPQHPGQVLLDILEDEDNNISIEDFASQLEVTVDYLTNVINGINPITQELANKIGSIFGNGPELWLGLQEQIDYWDSYYQEQIVSVNGEFKTWSVN